MGVVGGARQGRICGVWVKWVWGGVCVCVWEGGMKVSGFLGGTNTCVANTTIHAYLARLTDT